MSTAQNTTKDIAQNHRSTFRNMEVLQDLLQPPVLSFAQPMNIEPKVRLIRLDEINEEGHQAYRHALANVYASLDPDQSVRFIYLLDGSSKGVSLYFGVVADDPKVDIHEAMKNLMSALEGQLPGINLDDILSQQEYLKLTQHWRTSDKFGVMLGAPTGHEQDQATEELGFQGIDRLVRALQCGSRIGGHNMGTWQMLVVSQPLSRKFVRQQLDAAYELSSELACLVNTSIQSSSNVSQQKSTSSSESEARGENTSESQTRGRNDGASDTKNRGTSTSDSDEYTSRSRSTGTSRTISHGTSETSAKTTGTSDTRTTSKSDSISDTTGGSWSLSQELANKRAQHLMEYLDKQVIDRLHKGLTKGLFHTVAYLVAENSSTYQRLKNTVRATFQGSEFTLSPLEVTDLTAKAEKQILHLPKLDADLSSAQAMLFHSLHVDAHKSLGTLLTADELAIIAGLPQRELQGIRRRKTVDFIVDLPDISSQALQLGEIIDRGRRYPNNPVRLAKNDLNKHCFVTGVTGAGKTTTCMNLLLESGLPFLVIEPAKTEYRELAGHLDDILYYRPNGDIHQSLRLNPFALHRKDQHIKSHAGFLKNVFAAIFPMEASMPMMVEAAIIAAYEEQGWDIDETKFWSDEDPFAPINRAWPTMTDMIQQLDRLIPTYGLGKDFEEKYRGSLVSRLRSLTDGTLGQVLDVPQSIDFKALLTRRVVIELEEVQSGEEKALLMALILGGLNQSIRELHQENPQFRHLTLVEEAHRLLSRPDPGDKTAAMAVEAFADMLAEVRKYGAGLIIADQIPAKLIPDVIKNTHTKIVHRLFAEDDRRAMGEAMMMNEDQQGFLPNLGTGEAVIFCGGWHGPAHAAIRHDRAQTDNQHEIHISNYGVKQLWQERHRYYPYFCRLGWLTQDSDDPALFADFIRETRKAQNQFLFLIPNNTNEQRKDMAFIFIKNWIKTWDTYAQKAQGMYDKQRQDKDFEYWPSSLLPASWMALLLDANPLPKADQKNVRPLYEQDKEPLAQSIESLFSTFNRANNLKSWQQECNAPDNKILKRRYFDELNKFKKI